MPCLFFMSLIPIIVDALARRPQQHQVAPVVEDPLLPLAGGKDNDSQDRLVPDRTGDLLDGVTKPVLEPAFQDGKAWTAPSVNSSGQASAAGLPDRPSELVSPRAAIAGRVFVPGAPGYDQARQPWNLTVDERPAVVVETESTADVVQAVRYARAHGMRIAPQGTGHGARR